MLALKRAEEKALADEYSRARPEPRNENGEYRERFRRLREDRAEIRARIDALRPRSAAERVWSWFTES